MPVTPNADESTESKTVAVVPSGIAGNPDYYQSNERFADAVVSELEHLASKIGPISTVVVRGSYAVEQVLDEHTGGGLTVDSFSMDFRQFLNDTADDHSESVIQDGAPIEDYVYDVLDDPDVPRAEFDLDDRDHRQHIGYDVLSAVEDAEGRGRTGRAKAKAQARAMDMLATDWFDYVPTADAALILGDGTGHELAAQDVRGHHDWSDSDGVAGAIQSTGLQGGQGGVLNWTYRLVQTNDLAEDDLSESQLQRLRDTLTADEYATLNLNAAYEPTTDDSQTEPDTIPPVSSREVGRPRPDRASEAAAVAGHPSDD